eukprot:855601-Prymnesium_polylepis.2
MDSRGVRQRLAEATSTCEQSLERKLEDAVWRATMADEQAESTVTHGPCMPKMNEMRPAATDMAPPVAPYELSIRFRCEKSLFDMPTNTPVLLSH